MCEAIDWLIDGDSLYLGARGLWQYSKIELPNPGPILDSFSFLSHGALERYLKGLLCASDTNNYSAKRLKDDFGHDLVKLLGACRPKMTQSVPDEVHETCEMLNAELKWARYLVDAKRGRLSAAPSSFGIDRLDLSVRTLRNAAIGAVTHPCSHHGLLEQLLAVSGPGFELQCIFEASNLELANFSL